MVFSLFILIFAVALDPLWFLSPAKLTTRLYVPAPIFFNVVAFILIFAVPELSVLADPIFLPFNVNETMAPETFVFTVALYCPP